MSLSMDPTGDMIAEAVQGQFDKLPQKRKPQTRSEDVREWVPLSGIVAQGANPRPAKRIWTSRADIGARNRKRWLKMTGMKCLPQSKIPQAQGMVLHDWHAEIVAMRSFNYFLLKECQALASSQRESSEFLRRRLAPEVTESHFQPFTLREDISLHMYCSEAPCGDASMELVMASQEDATPWPLPSSFPDPGTKKDPQSSTSNPLPGRGYFSELGIVRRKPSRPDAQPTLSKSCSDKLASRQCISLLSSPLSLLISPENLYLKTLTLPSSQHSPPACERAFGPTGRLAAFRGRQWPGGYRYQPYKIKTTEREFQFSRRSGGDGGQRLVPSGLAAMWTPYGEETLIGGMLQGRKQFDPKGASVLCKREMWKLAMEVAVVSGVPTIIQTLSMGSYELLKLSGLLENRRLAKKEVRDKALREWVGNGGDDFGLDS